MIEFDTPLTDREKLIALVSACPFTDRGKFYKSVAINSRLGNIAIDDGAMDTVIENTIKALAVFYNVIKVKKGV